MQKPTTILVTGLALLALSGCASHHQGAAPHAMSRHQISSTQAGENALKNGLAGGPLTTHTKPLTDFNLSGYHH